MIIMLYKLKLDLQILYSVIVKCIFFLASVVLIYITIEYAKAKGIHYFNFFFNQNRLTKIKLIIILLVFFSIV